MKPLLLGLILTFSHWTLAQENRLITSLKPGAVVKVLSDINVPGGDWATFSEGQLHERFVSEPKENATICKMGLSDKRGGRLSEVEVIKAGENLTVTRVDNLYAGMEVVNLQRSDRKIVSLLCNSFSEDGPEIVPTIKEVQEATAQFLFIP